MASTAKKMIQFGWCAAPITNEVVNLESLAKCLREELARVEEMAREGFVLNLSESPTGFGACLLELHTSDERLLTKYAEHITEEDDRHEEDEDEDLEHSHEEQIRAPGLTVEGLLGLVQTFLDSGSATLNSPVRILKYHAGCSHIEELVATDVTRVTALHRQ